MKPVSPSSGLYTLAHSPEEARTEVNTFAFTLGKGGPRVSGFVELKRGPFLTEGVLELVKNTLKQSLSPLPQPEELEERFEDAILEANDVLAKHFNEQEDSSEHFLAAAVVLVSASTIFFSIAKEARAYLVRQAESPWENLSSDEGSSKSKKMFGSLFSGSVAAGDTLVVASRAFFDSVPQEEFRALLKKPAANFEERLEQTLVDPAIPVAALIARGAPPADTGRLSTKKRGKKTWALPSLLTLKNSSTIMHKNFVGALTWLVDRLLPPTEPRAPKEATPQTVRVFPLTHLLKYRKAILILVLVGVSVSLLGVAAYQARAQREATRYNQTLEKIAAAQSEIEAALIYHDTDRAKAKLKAARDLLQELPQTTAARRARAAVIREELDSVSKKFQFVLLPEPKTITSFATASATNAIHPNLIGKLLKTKTSVLLLVDGKLKTVGLLDLEQQTPKLDLVNVDASLIPEIVRLLPMEGNALLLLKNNALLELTLGDKPKLEPRSIDSAPSSIAAAALYQKKLYVVDAARSRITKHLPTAGGFGKGQVWIADAQELSNTADLTIDGALWIASSSGQIFHYFQGKKQTFPVLVDPALTGPIQLATTIDSPFLYVLEPKGNRVVVLQKESTDTRAAGTLVAQYIVDRWTDLKALAIDERTKELYVMNADALEKIVMTHLDTIKTKSKTAAPASAKKKIVPAPKTKKTP